MRFLPDPEARWERPPHTDAVDRAEVERRIGPTSGPLEALAGGRANLNVRVGADRVLRVYRRDPLAARVEAALLRRPWESFRVPAVLLAGDDFVVLEHVPHGPVRAGAEEGAAVGRALAEIHRLSFPRAGFLDAELAVRAPFADVVDALGTYARAQLGRAAPALAEALRPAVAAFLDRSGDALRARAGSPVLLHGDFKASNLHWTGDGALLVLDWEFAYAGPALMDVGQLVRWDPPRPFADAFARSYREGGGELADDWRRWAGAFDVVNLVSLLAGAAPGSRRAADVRRRIHRVLADLA